jgi:hypothetical protein
MAVADAKSSNVTVIRLRQGGVQPQVAVDGKGIVHLIYLVGDPAATDVFYQRSSNYGTDWSEPAKVNGGAGSAIAMGTVRGAHLAVGKGGRVHVAWMGGKDAEPKAPGGKTPMLYTRSTDDGKGGATFEPQRNLITDKIGLDGGGSVAADDQGNVYVAWHAPEHKGNHDESDRRVWVAVSTDEGKTFAAERALSPEATGVCGCCGMRAFATGGRLFALYRSATAAVNRDIYLLAADGKALAGAKAAIASTKVAPMKSAVCVMSTADFAGGAKAVVAAYEAPDAVGYDLLDPQTGEARKGVIASKKGAKHPAVAVNSKGEVLLAWAEGTGWNKGGTVAWQVTSGDGALPLSGRGREGLPVWGRPAAFARPDGSFVVLY